MTVILILLCLAIAGRELYNASDRRLPRAQADIAELRGRLAELESAGRTAPTAPEPTVIAAPAMASPPHGGPAGRVTLPGTTGATGAAGGPDGTSGRAGTETDEALALLDLRLRELHDRLDRGDQVMGRLDEELSNRVTDLRGRVDELADGSRRFGERLGELEHVQAQERGELHGLARSLDGVEDLLGRIRDHVTSRLEQAARQSLDGEVTDTVRGLILGTADVSRDALLRLYDGCAEQHGLRIELTDEVGGSPWRVRYFLSGPAPRELERDVITLVSGLQSALAHDGDAPQGSAALRALALGLQAAGTGTAQLGPLVVTAVPGSVLCGVLPLAELQCDELERLLADPEALAVRLRALAAGRFCDLSDLSELNGHVPAG